MLLAHHDVRRVSKTASAEEWINLPSPPKFSAPQQMATAALEAQESALAAEATQASALELVPFRQQLAAGADSHVAISRHC